MTECELGSCPVDFFSLYPNTPSRSSSRRRSGPTRRAAHAISQLERKRRIQVVIFNSEFVETLVGPGLRRDDGLIVYEGFTVLF